MEILNLTLANFRNFVSQKIVFDQKLTVIIGPNGSGKSNILEAISMLCGIRPVHIENDIDLVNFGKKIAKIEGKVRRDSKDVSLTINFLVSDSKLGKTYFVDSFKKRLLDLIGYLAIVVFHPQDLDLVSGSPSFRRHHVDTLLLSLDREYWRHLSAYSKVITRRNKILQRIMEAKAKPAELTFWDARLLEHGSFLSKRKQEFFEFLNFIEKTEHMHNMKDLSWELKQSFLTEEKLLKNRDRDIAAGMTLSGPHRDDFRFISKGRDLAYFGSRGEQRMAVLALKLSELEYVSRKRGERPILALDDIFSELDWDHREAVLSVVGNQQTIITAAERESVPSKLLKKARFVEL